MKDELNERYKQLKHIREIYDDIKKSLHQKNSENLQSLEEEKSIQTIFLYINGDPQYIRKIYLN